MTDTPPTRVIFLAGIGRSGSTLIERALGEIPGVTALGEVMHLWERGLVRGELCSCGTPFRQCPFWSVVGADAFGSWDNVDPERMAYLKGRVDRTVRIPQTILGRSASFVREADEYVDYFARLYAAAAALTGGVVVDSSKQPSLAWLLQRSAAIDLRVVHCIRDSRGVAHSWSKIVARPEAVGDDHATMGLYSPVKMSAHWLYHNAAAEALRLRVPTVRVRYEDFVDAPVNALGTILSAADVPIDLGRLVGTTLTVGTGHSCAGNPMRFRRGSVEIVRDDRWRDGQRSSQRRLVTTLTAPLLLRYGYAGRR